MDSQADMTAAARNEAKELGKRAGNIGYSLKVCPYSNEDPLKGVWLDAWTRATEQRIARGGASPI